MTPAGRQALKEALHRHEGCRTKPYLDCCVEGGKSWRLCKCERKGNLTIGVGRNLDGVGLSEDEIEILLENDVDRAERALKPFPWYGKLSDARQQVLVNMVFNLGAEGFQGFKRMISSLALGLYDVAANEMLRSAWSAQVKRRAVELAQMMRGG